MLSVGVDLHRRYSQLEVLDYAGMRPASARLSNELEHVAGFFRSLGEPCRVVLEASWNWGSMYDWLEGIENIVEVQLAHPDGVRAIAGGAGRHWVSGKWYLANLSDPRGRKAVTSAGGRVAPAAGDSAR